MSYKLTGEKDFTREIRTNVPRNVVDIAVYQYEMFSLTEQNNAGIHCRVFHTVGIWT